MQHGHVLSSAAPFMEYIIAIAGKICGSIGQLCESFTDKFLARSEVPLKLTRDRVLRIVGGVESNQAAGVTMKSVAIVAAGEKMDGAGDLTEAFRIEGDMMRRGIDAVELIIDPLKAGWEHPSKRSTIVPGADRWKRSPMRGISFHPGSLPLSSFPVRTC